MKKAIVCTTINEPTIALTQFSFLEDWDLIVVGDSKTPEDWHLNNCHYMSPEKQEKEYPILSKLLGWNTVDRRNLGFLEAYKRGADILAMVDDDNIPMMGHWGKNVMVGQEIEVDCFNCNDVAFDPLSVVGGNSSLWHRGFPIELVNSRNLLPSKTMETRKILVQEDLWDGDPDVDAICRMKDNPEVQISFNTYFASNKPSPFNMQNTFVAREAIKYLMSIPFTGRMCDIWGAYYFQSLFPLSVIYAPASVNHLQERDWSSIVRDLEQEILGYKFSLQLLKDLKQHGSECIHKYIPERSSRFIEEYQKHF